MTLFYFPHWFQPCLQEVSVLVCTTPISQMEVWDRKKSKQNNYAINTAAEISWHSWSTRWTRSAITFQNEKQKWFSFSMVGLPVHAANQKCHRFRFSFHFHLVLTFCFIFISISFWLCFDDILLFTFYFDFHFDF